MLRSLLLTVWLTAPLTLRAQDSLRAACDTAITTLDMRRCVSRDLDEAERQLQRYLREARRHAADRALLDSAETAWAQYRDVACRAAGSQYQGGTMMPLVVLGCRLALTRNRTHELWDHYLRVDEVLPEPRP